MKSYKIMNTIRDGKNYILFSTSDLYPGTVQVGHSINGDWTYLERVKIINIFNVALKLLWHYIFVDYFGKRKPPESSWTMGHFFSDYRG